MEVAELVFGTFSVLVGESTRSLAAPIAGSIYQSVMQRKQEKARDILIEQLRKGERTLVDGDAEEIVLIIDRYARASREGATNLNLELLAQVIASQYRSGRLVANEFLFYADFISSMRREEIILVGVFWRHWQFFGKAGLDDDNRASGVFVETCRELVPNIFPDENELIAYLGAITRTGLILTTSGFGTLLFKPSSLMRKLDELISIDAAVSQSDE